MFTKKMNKYVLVLVCLLTIGFIGFAYSNSTYENRILKHKVGQLCCPSQKSFDYTCFIASLSCSSFQKYRSVSGIDFPDGCLPGASWNWKCNGQQNYTVFGQDVIGGYETRTLQCLGLYRYGSCYSNFLKSCVPDSGQTSDCPGSWNQLLQCAF